MTKPLGRIFMDNNSTTVVDPRVVEMVVLHMTCMYGNSSSADHVFGDEAEVAVEEAASKIRHLFKADDYNVVFTSGATESINLAIRGSLCDGAGNCEKIALMPLEHKAVIDTCKILQREKRVALSLFNIDVMGRLDLQHVDDLCKKEQVDFITVMGANNEIGNVYKVGEISKIAEESGIPFFCDASQAAGKIPIDLRECPITMMAISGHKMYGPKGVGALLVKKGHRLTPILYGGGQQNGLRPGTLNVPGIVGIGEACRLRELEMHGDEQRIRKMRDRLENTLRSSIADLVVNGDPDQTLSGTLHIAIPDVPNDAIISRMRDRLAVSTGAACTSETVSPSHVLQAMNVGEDIMNGALRISIGKFNTDSEICSAAEMIIGTVHDIRKTVKQFGGC